ncbi:hypothetical protein [Deinococcus sp. SL84]|uniref:hypothetical protein n=1 Tax=Deinococcus sp. SL84 TaxID=2994663 RepID=UPI002275692F|nr:hypothetical protein [Deinococcus sp. SL84]MCY1704011.1 hypothetical protein [Deinococcus sp. SL84]
MPADLAPEFQAISLAGQTLTGVPAAFQLLGTDERNAELARTCAHLIEAGVLPPLPVSPGEYLQDYLHRLGHTPAPHDLLHTELLDGAHTFEEEGFWLEVQLKRRAEPVRPGRWFRQLGRVHPHLCGSILSGISKFSFLRCPVYTAYNAYCDITEMHAPRKDDASYWRSLNHELYSNQLQKEEDTGWLTLRPVSSTQLAAAAKEDPYSPPNLKRAFGHQAYQVFTKPHKELDFEEISLLGERCGLSTLSEIAECLEELGNLNAEFLDAGGDECLDLMGNFAGRAPARFIMAGRTRPGQESLEEELYRDYQDLIENGGEECEPLLLLPVNSHAEARLARTLLDICQQALIITERMMTLLTAGPQNSLLQPLSS